MKLNKLLIATLDKQITELEAQIEALIKQDEELQNKRNGYALYLELEKF
ncbi:MAG: hypothetical protein U0T32_12345 [Chitinophagales bacterium]